MNQANQVHTEKMVQTEKEVILVTMDAEELVDLKERRAKTVQEVPQVPQVPKVTMGLVVQEVQTVIQVIADASAQVENKECKATLV